MIPKPAVAIHVTTVRITTVLTTTITVINGHDGHHHEHQPFVSYTFHNLQTLTHTQWIDFCNKLPSTVLRVKGIVPTTSGPMELQYTLQSCSLTDTHLKDYHLVVIGTDIDISSIQEKVCSAS